MEYIQQINPDRIHWCCDDYGITPDQLAGHLKMSPTRFESVMAGENGLTFKQLRAVANYFHRGALFFLDSKPVREAQVRTPQFRTIARRKPGLLPELKALIERVERHCDLYLSLCEDLGEKDPRFDPPELPARNPARAAQIVREWLCLEEENDFTHYRAAVEGKGLLVFRSMGYAGGWKIPDDSQIIGFSLYRKTGPAIVIKKQASEPRQSFTLMHELGHLLLHRDSFIDEESDLQDRKGREQAANAFAGHLLVPDAFLDSISDKDRPANVAEFDDWLGPHRKRWGVSGEVILRRLLDSRRLSQAIYQAYRDWSDQRPYSKKTSGTRQYRHREPLHILGEQFVRTVFDSLHAQQISLNKASAYLDNLKIKDVHKLEDHLVGL
jgi:Zn-dependent peptidase ImmA (M78 family)